MSVMSEMAYDIEQLYIEGEHPTKIAGQLGIPLSMVYGWLTEVGVGAAEEEYSPHITINS
jgi:hypothetical protein